MSETCLCDCQVHVLRPLLIACRKGNKLLYVPACIRMFLLCKLLCSLNRSSDKTPPPFSMSDYVQIHATLFIMLHIFGVYLLVGQIAKGPGGLPPLLQVAFRLYSTDVRNQVGSNMFFYYVLLLYCMGISLRYCNKLWLIPRICFM